ncbi:DUF6731 family protein [Caenispirillum salinarum]|uniref:DUF6731 family protein n=1 Tax=Caenispirillum salinarum TaxID=859058 RepID=UPI0012670AAC|nr:DUF6731 family protein [Caenispirillum salinarum]
MDTTVNIRFFEVQRQADFPEHFSECLSEAADLDLAEREVEIQENVVLRLERLEEKSRGRILAGELVRLQSQNLPARAMPGQPLQRLGVPSIGHSTAFRYDRSNNILALQMGRNGITPARVAMYVQEVAGVDGFYILPVISQEWWEKLATERVRALAFRVARPDRLDSVSQETQTIIEGLEAMKQAGQSAFIDMSFTMGRSPEDISSGFARRLVRWLLRQHEEGEAGVKRLTATLRNDETRQTETFPLLRAQVGDRRKLDLPDDDPAEAYNIKDRFIRELWQAKRRAIEEMFPPNG